MEVLIHYSLSLIYPRRPRWLPGITVCSHCFLRAVLMTPWFLGPVGSGDVGLSTAHPQAVEADPSILEAVHGFR